MVSDKQYYEKVAKILNRWIDINKPSKKPSASWISDTLNRSNVTASIFDSYGDIERIRIIYIVFLMQEGMTYDEAFKNTERIYYITIDDVDGISEEEETCNDCNGSGRIGCDYCEEDGIEVCDSCGGDGKDSDGDDCWECSGSGETDCDRCDGDGKVECEDCGGDGVIKTGENIYIISTSNWLTINYDSYKKLLDMVDNDWGEDLFEDDTFKTGDWILTRVRRDNYELPEYEVERELKVNESKVVGGGLISTDNFVYSEISKQFSVVLN